MTCIKKIRPVLCVGLISLLCSCEFFEETFPLSVFLPVLPAEYHCVISSWEISILHEDLSSETVWLIGSCASFIIDRGREETLCVLGTATLDSGFILKPAGVFINSPGEKTLCFEDGPALTVLFDLSLRGYNLSRFNSIRFTEELINRQEGSPWFWDLDSLAFLIQQGEFSLNKLAHQTLFPVTFNRGEAEDWVSEDIKIGRISSPDIYLPPGRHRFFSFSLRRKRDIIIYDEGEYLFFDFLIKNSE